MKKTEAKNLVTLPQFITIENTKKTKINVYYSIFTFLIAFPCPPYRTCEPENKRISKYVHYEGTGSRDRIKYFDKNG
jgi:hypothetical protein